MDFLPKELENIIIGYKKDMEIYEKQYDKISDMLGRFEPISSINIEMNYLDFKDYFFKNNLQHKLKFQVDIYGDGHPNNNNFWDLDIINDDDSLLHPFTVTEVFSSNFMGIIYLRFEEIKADANDIDMIEDMDNTYLIDSDDDSEDIEMLMELI